MLLESHDFCHSQGHVFILNTFECIFLDGLLDQKNSNVIC